MKLSLRIKRHDESYEVRDALGAAMSYTYFEDETGRQDRLRRVSEAEAREIAKLIARALTDAKEAGRLP